MRQRFAALPELLAIIGVALVLVLVPLVTGRAKVGPVPLESLTLAVPVALALCIPLLRRAGSAGIPHIGIELPAMAFLLIALVGIPFSTSASGSLGTWVRYASYIALIPVVATLTRKDSERRVLLWILVAAGMGTVLFGIVQYLNPQMLTPIGMSGLDEKVTGRIYSTFANPNFYSEYLVLLIGATLSLAFRERGFRRGLAVALLALQGFALLATYTRGSWLALAVGLVVAAMMIDVRYLWGLLGAAVLAAVAVPGVGKRIASIFSLSGTASFRLRLWRLTGTIISQHPAVGVGIGQFVPAFKLVSVQHPELATSFLIYGAHNSYFTLMAETGVLGGLAFIWLVLAICKMGVYYGSRMDGDLSAKLQNAALTVGLVAFAVNALTSNSFQHPQAAVFFWVVAGIQAGLGARFWSCALDEHAQVSVPPKRAAGVFSGSAILRSVLATVRFLQAAWRDSDARRWVIAAPRGNGDILRRSRLVRFLFGKGDPKVAEAECS